MTKTRSELLQEYSSATVIFNKANRALQEYIFQKIQSGENPTTGEHGKYLNYYGLIGIGGWSCEKSPIFACCYNEFTDSAFDHCVFCGEPDERK